MNRDTKRAITLILILFGLAFLIMLGSRKSPLRGTLMFFNVESEEITELTEEESLKKEEEQRQREKEKQEALQREEEKLAKEEESLKKLHARKVPYEGMSKKYIDSTIVGMHDAYELETIKVSGKTIYKHKYIWYASNGYDVPLIVICKDGIVSNVYKYYTDTYWDSNGMPHFGNSRSKNTYSQKTYNSSYFYVNH